MKTWTMMGVENKRLKDVYMVIRIGKQLEPRVDKYGTKMVLRFEG